MNIVDMLRKSAIFILLLAYSLADAGPVVVPFKPTNLGFVISVKIGDSPEQKMALSTRVMHSCIFIGSKAPVMEGTLSIGGYPIGEVSFGSSTVDEDSSGCVGVIGYDMLKDVAVGVDLFKGEMSLWPKGNISKNEASSWVQRSAPWPNSDTPRVFGLASKPNEIPVLETGISGRRLRMLADFTMFGSTIASGSEPGNVSPISTDIAKDDYILAPKLTISGSELPWFFYLRETMPLVEDLSDDNLQGSVSPDVFASRRVLYDFAAGRIYAESLSRDAILSLRLTSQLRVPLLVRADTILLDLPPGYAGYSELAQFLGSTVLTIADVPIAEVLHALRGSGKDECASLAGLFAKSRREYLLGIRRKDGELANLRIRQGAPKH